MAPSAVDETASDDLYSRPRPRPQRSPAEAAQVRIRNRRREYLEQNPDYFRSAEHELAGKFPQTRGSVPVSCVHQTKEKCSVCLSGRCTGSPVSFRSSIPFICEVTSHSKNFLSSMCCDDLTLSKACIAILLLLLL